MKINAIVKLVDKPSLKAIGMKINAVVNLSLRNLGTTEFDVFIPKGTASWCPKRDAIGEGRGETPIVPNVRCLKVCRVFGEEQPLSV